MPRMAKVTERGRGGDDDLCWTGVLTMLLRRGRLRRAGGGSRMALSALLLGAALGGCGSDDGSREVRTAAAVSDPAELEGVRAMLARVAPARPERLSYVPPAGAAAPALDQRVAAAPAAVFDSAQQALRERGLRITHVDERAGIITATHSGDPADFVDCGAITAVPARGEARQLQAASEAISFRRGVDRSSAVVERELVLYARLVLRLRPDGNGTRVRSSATYVLSKRVNAGDQLQVETVTFESGGRARFAKGTICQPTGALERLPLTAA